MRFYHITLLLLPVLLLTVACSVDTVEDSDAGILDPTPTDFRFQNLPIIDGAGGSLIPLDEIPVITIEKTREDDDFGYWQLRADPAPIHEDLVVGVSLREYEWPDFFEREDNEPETGNLEVEVRLEDGSISKIHINVDGFIRTYLRNEGYFRGNFEIGGMLWLS